MTEHAKRMGERLRQAREEAGLSQQQVADWLSVRRPAVAEFESGVRAIKSDELVRLTHLYGKSVAWLTGGAKTDDSLAGALFRARDKVDATLRREANLLARRCRVLHDAESRMRLHAPRALPQYANDDALADQSDAAEHGRLVAYQERNRLSLGVHAPLGDVWGIVEAAGLRVFPLRLGSSHDVDGIFAVFGAGHTCVGVNVDKWLFRQIFTVVHEYAHALFDQSAGAEFCETASAWSSARSPYANRELRANQFAAVFLVPREALVSHLDATGKLSKRGGLVFATNLTAVDIVRAQDHFGASAEMILWRLKNEDLIASSERHRLSTELNARGVNALARSLGIDWRRYAKPITRAQETALTAYAQGHLSLGQLAEIFGHEKDEMLTKLSEWGVSQEFGETDALVGAAHA